MLSLVIPVYKNAGSIGALLQALQQLHGQTEGRLEVVFVIDGSPDACYSLLREALPQQPFAAQLILLSRNFGAFMAIRAGLQAGSGTYFAVMAADLQEPPALVPDMLRLLRDDRADVVVGVREGRDDPLLSRLASQTFWYCYRRLVMPDIPPGGVDMFACNKVFRDTLLTLEERNSSLIAQLFWIGFRRQQVSYTRLARADGQSGWTLRKKVNYLMDSVFSFTDLPIRLLIRCGAGGAVLAALFGAGVLVARLMGSISVPGYAMTMAVMTFLGSLNLLGLGIVGSYAWRTYENTKRRPLAIVMRSDHFPGVIP